MVPILSFTLLPNQNYDGVGMSSVRGTIFDGNILN